MGRGSAGGVFCTNLAPSTDSAAKRAVTSRRRARASAGHSPGAATRKSNGVPPLVVSDRGHQTGPRVIDYPRFSGAGEAAACLVEAGQHWQPETVDVMQAATDALLRRTVMGGGTLAPPAAVRCAEVTRVVTAATSSFAFVQPFRGGDVVPRRNTLIALDGTAEIRTPHDDCLLVMPTLRASRGHTAVRLARFVPELPG